MKKRVKWLVAGLVLFVVACAAHFALFAGVFGGIQPGFAGTCSATAVGGGAADLRIDRDRGVAYLSTLDRAAQLRGEAVTGTVMLLDLNLAAPAPRAAMAYDPPEFRPGALSLLKTPGAPARLFVLSDREDGGRVVQVADQDPGGAFVPREQIVDAAFARAVALAAVGPREFYLASDASDAGLLARWWSSVTHRRASTVLFYDGRAARVVVRDLGAPAGLALSPDGSRLLLSDSLARQLLIFRRDIAGGGLTLESSVPLDTTPDRIDVDAQGVVWIAAHPRLMDSLSPGRRAATQVLRFDPRSKAPPTQVYGNDGGQLSAASVAAGWREEFLVGAPLDSKVLICKTNP